MKNDYNGFKNIEFIEKEIQVCKTYNRDHRCTRGSIKQIVNHLHPKNIECKVTDIRKETESAKTIRLTPIGGYIPPFIPGQYINLEVEVDGIRTSRAYSISSSATQGAYYEITVRATKNGFVSDYLLNKLKLGDLLTCSSPTGNFYQFPVVHGKRLVFIAGGSGITPFMSMLQTDYEKLIGDKKIDLIYGCSKESDIIFYDKLKELSQKGILNLHPIISDPESGCTQRTGFISAELIKEIVGNVENCTFFLCGPCAMYDFVLPELKKIGVIDRKIRREVQTMPTDPTKLPGWPINITDADQYVITLPEGKKITAKATETVLTVLERNGVVVPSLCRSGECSACRTKLISGKVFHPGNELLRKSDMKFGYMHPCVTYPISDIEILL